MTTIVHGHARIASPGLSKHVSGNFMDQLLLAILVTAAWPETYDRIDTLFLARNLLSSIAQWLTQDWAEHPDRGENFQASLTILECLEELQ